MIFHQSPTLLHIYLPNMVNIDQEGLELQKNPEKMTQFCNHVFRFMEGYISFPSFWAIELKDNGQRIHYHHSFLLYVGLESMV